MVVASGPCRLKTQDRVLLMLRNKSFVILCKKRLARTKNRFSEERGLRSSQQPRYLFELIKETLRGSHFMVDPLRKNRHCVTLIK